MISVSHFIYFFFRASTQEEENAEAKNTIRRRDTNPPVFVFLLSSPWNLRRIGAANQSHNEMSWPTLRIKLLIYCSIFNQFLYNPIIQ